MLKKLLQMSLIMALGLLNKSNAQSIEPKCVTPPTVLPEHKIFLVDDNGCIQKILSLNEEINEESQIININEVHVDIRHISSNTGSFNIFSSH